jgi:hypothetical protein
MQLQQQMLATQKLLQAQEAENNKLQQEMERLARAKVCHSIRSFLIHYKRACDA